MNKDLIKSLKSELNRLNNLPKIEEFKHLPDYEKGYLNGRRNLLNEILEQIKSKEPS